MLKIRYKNNKYSAVWLVEPKISIGRSATNDLVIDDPFVADKHIEVHVSHETLTLKNLQPMKPVRVNNSEVIGACTLKEDDEIVIGSVELLVIDPKRESKVVQQDASESTQLRSAATTGWALKANHAALANRVFPLKGVTVIGRAADCDISLAAAHLSRRHAQLQIVDGALYVKDLGSANGTFLNGKQVSEARVKRGDELRFDALVFGVMGPADELAKTTVRPVPPPKSAPKSIPAEVVAKRAAMAPSFANVEPTRRMPVEEKRTVGKPGLILLGVIAVVVILTMLLKGK